MNYYEYELITEGFVLQFSRNDELKSVKPSFRNLRAALEDNYKYENPILFGLGEEWDYSFSRNASGRVCVFLEKRGGLE